MKRARSFLLLFLGLIVILCGLTAWTVHRERRQERLNRDIIAAVRNNDTKAVVSLLNQGADANCHDEPYKLLPWWQMLRDRLRGVKPKASTEDTPLQLALDNQFGGDVPLPLIQALLDHKAEVNVRDGGTVIPRPFLTAIGSRNKATLHLLLKYGSDMNPYRKDENAPLVEVVDAFGDTEVLSDMLQRGADVNQRDAIGKTALYMAVDVENIEAVRLLLSYHADVTLQGADGLTPLALAKSVLKYETEDNEDSAKSRQILHLLQQAGVKE